MFGKNFKKQKIRTPEVKINTVWGGEGKPVLLLHGYPQTHVMWHAVAHTLASNFLVVCPDLRGYGDSSKPAGKKDHSNYSKRAMASDMVSVMEALGFREFYVAGHDRGARVLHRMCLDHPEKVRQGLRHGYSTYPPHVQDRGQAFRHGLLSLVFSYPA